MNDDIRTRLSRAVSDAMHDAAPTEPQRRAAIESVRARRRRRPVTIIATVLASLTVVSTGAYAIQHVTRSTEQVTIPDRIGPGLVAPTQDGPTPTADPVDPAGQDDPAPTPAPTPPPAPSAVSLPSADPDARFPQCGAVVTASAELQPVELYGALRPPTRAGVELYSANSSYDVLSGRRSDATLALVRDGVVVGASTSAPPPSTPFELGNSFPENMVNHSSPVAYSPCSGGPGRLPAGHYSIWGSQELEITARTQIGVDGTPGSAVATHEEVTTLAQVAHIWIDEAGAPVLTPDTAAGWPEAVVHDTAFSGQLGPLSSVWLTSEVDAPYGTLTTHEEWLLQLGYFEGTFPSACGVYDGSRTHSGGGVGVIFASRTEADAFVARYEPLHGPVLKIVDGSVSCGE